MITPVAEAPPVVPWLTDGREEWLGDVADWVSQTLGVDVPVGALESIKERPWSAVLRADTISGVVFFKAVGPRGRHETTLLSDFAAGRTNLAPSLIAVDHARGWLLMPQHGDDISQADPDLQITTIESLLPDYAVLQRLTSHHSDHWIAAGVTDRTPQRLPALLEDLLAGRRRSNPLPVAAEEMARFREVLDTFAQVCDDLAGGTVPMAIDHADIHGTNVLVGDGPRLIDWGDSCIGHPFSSLLVPLEWVAGRVHGPERVRAVERLIDAYLEPWGSEADRTVLGHAIWAGYVARAVSNDEQSTGGSPADVADAQREIVALLRAWEAKHPVVDTPAQLAAPSMVW